MKMNTTPDRPYNGSFLINKEPFYLPQGNEIQLLSAAHKHKLPVILQGPTSTGKTRLVEYMAWKLKLPLHTVACNDDLSQSDLVGRFLLKGDYDKGSSMQWQDGPLLMAVRNGGIAYLDEIVEARKDTTVVIHPLADHRRILPVEKLGTQYEAPDAFMLVMSYNPGYQSVVKELKPSTRQRFVAVTLNWPDVDLETQIITHESGVGKDIARKLSESAGKIRNLHNEGLEEGVGTRELVNAGTLINEGIDYRDALFSTMIEPITHDEDLRKSIEEILGNYFNL